jgi:hypothetical protein
MEACLETMARLGPQAAVAGYPSITVPVGTKVPTHEIGIGSAKQERQKQPVPRCQAEIDGVVGCPEIVRDDR